MAALGMTLVIAAAASICRSARIGRSARSSIALAAAARRAARRLAALAASRRPRPAACVTGVLVTRLRVVPFIVTLGMMLLVRGAAKGLADERRIEAPATWLNDLLRTRRPGGLLLPAGHLAAARAGARWSPRVLRYTRFGRHLFAIGSNERTARLCGVRVERDQGRSSTRSSAALAGLAGVLQFSKLSVGDPTVAVGLELDVIAAVIIGGGSLLGRPGHRRSARVLGAAIMTVIQIGCSQRGLPNWVQQIVTGGDHRAGGRARPLAAAQRVRIAASPDGRCARSARPRRPRARARASAGPRGR